MVWSESKKRYQKSEKGRQARRRYQQSAKGRETHGKYLAKRRAKLTEARKDKTNEVKEIKDKKEAIAVKKE